MNFIFRLNFFIFKLLKTLHFHFKECFSYLILGTKEITFIYFFNNFGMKKDFYLFLYQKNKNKN